MRCKARRVSFAGRTIRKETRYRVLLPRTYDAIDTHRDKLARFMVPA